MKNLVVSRFFSVSAFTGFFGVIAGLILIIPVPAYASSVTISDGTFGSFSTTTPVLSDPGITSSVVQCTSCGNPNFGLQINFAFPNTGTANFSASLAVIDNTLTYDPTTQGVITSINTSVDKNLTTTAQGTITNTFRPLIEQGGNIYLAAVSGNTFNNPPTSSTSYLAFSASGLAASDFSLYDPTTGSLDPSTNPDFGGSAMLLGLGQFTSYPPGTIAEVDYDNLSFTINSGVPEPSTWAMMILGFAGIGFMAYRRSRKDQGLALAAA
jgi:PEP-CTERM motif